jgi:menaquinone-9 beta-reductase
MQPVAELSCDVLVIGGGPAGSTCARLLAAAGRDVLVLDARQVGGRKLCGGLLNRRAQLLLEDQGLSLPPAACVEPAQPLLEYHDLDNRLRACYTPGYRNIDRGAFDAWLLELARQAGARVISAARVQSVEQPVAADEAYLAQSTAGSVQARWVVDASGASACGRRQLGLPMLRRLDCLQGALRLDPPLANCWAVYQTARTPFFGWLIPKAGGVCYAGAGLPPGQLMRQRQQRRTRFQTPWPEQWDGLGWLLDYLSARGYRWEPADVKPHGAPLVWLARLGDVQCGRGRLLLAGEAAGLASPFSGEGVSFALASGAAAAQCVLAGQGAAELGAELAGERRRLWLALAQAYVGARPRLRPWGLALLPRLTGRELSRLGWDGQGAPGYNQDGGAA